MATLALERRPDRHRLSGGEGRQRQALGLRAERAAGSVVTGFSGWLSQPD